MKPRAWAVAGLIVIAAVALTRAYAESAPTVHRFRLEAHFTFDGQPFIAIGYMECTYQRAPISGNRPHPAKGPPIKDGYYTETSHDAPSLVLPDGKSAIVFRHAATCPSLPALRRTFAIDPASASGATWPAYYFPDRNDPGIVWILRDRRPAHADSGRLVLSKYLFVTVNEPIQVSIAQNVPAAWKWYEEYSAKYRKALSGGGGSYQSQDAIWRGIYACVLQEDEWRGRPDFVQAAAGIAAITVVTINEPGRERAHNCPSNVRTPQISLVPSDDYSKATLELRGHVTH